jgi:hypothetical protein
VVSGINILCIEVDGQTKLIRIAELAAFIGQIVVDDFDLECGGCETETKQESNSKQHLLISHQISIYK